jgi:hypothetical protein
VDLDYKGLGNIGCKLIGRLDTENDRHRALEGLDLSDETAATTVAGLQPRQFLLAGPRVGAPRVVSSRWAMSYLRGPLTLAELKPLVAASPKPAATPQSPAAASRGAAPVLSGVTQLYGAGQSLIPALLCEGRALLRKASPAVERELSGPWLARISDQGIVWETLTQRDPGSLGDQPPSGASFAALPADTAEQVRSAGKELARELAARPVNVLWHRNLKIVQEEGESEGAFRERCVQAARAKSVAATEQARRRSEDKLRAVVSKLGRETDELDRDRQDLAARQRQEQISVAAGVGDTILSGLGALFGGRRSGIGTAVRRGASTAKQWSDKQRMTERARGEVEESEQTIAELEAERTRLQADLDAELKRLDDEAVAAAAEFQPLALRPAAKDVTVRRVCLIWLSADELP